MKMKYCYMYLSSKNSAGSVYSRTVFRGKINWNSGKINWNSLNMHHCFELSYVQALVTHQNVRPGGDIFFYRRGRVRTGKDMCFAGGDVIDRPANQSGC